MLLFMPVSLLAQESIDSVLAQIEKNNSMLAALRTNTEAEKIGNRTGIYLENPEVGFNYLWVDPAAVGNRMDLNVRQSFDFPAAYVYRKNLAESRNSQADLEYEEELRQVRLEARLLCTDLIYLNALLREYEARHTRAQELADAYQAMFDNGQTGILELNKVKLNRLNTEKELESLQIKRAAGLKELAALNGGIPLEIDSESIPGLALPPDFDQWYRQAEQDSPTLRRMEEAAQASAVQEKLSRALSLPRASAGYMSENRTGEHFQGITVGISIPLFEHKNTVKYARVKTLAWENIAADYRVQLHTRLRIQYDKAVSLQKTVEDYRQSLSLYQNGGLLKKALDQGEISLLEYLMELTLTYSTIDQYLEAENECNRAIALLHQYGE